MMVATMIRKLRAAVVAVAVLSLSGCDDPQVYGSVGISSGYGSYGGCCGPRMHTSVSVGGRIR